MNWPIVSDDNIERVQFMTYEERASLTNTINATNPQQIFEAAGQSSNSNVCKIICPNCGNGRTSKDRTPIEVKFHEGKWLYHCFKDNDLEGTLLTIISTENNLNRKDFNEYCKALAIGANLIGYSLPESKNQKLFKLVREDIRKAQSHINELPEDQRRGLGEATLAHFGFGYLTEWKHPNILLNGKDMPATRRIIIPTQNHYNAVALPTDRAKIEKKYWKMHTSPKELFNAAALLDDNNLILLTEGEIDAASIWQAFKGNISVVAVCAVTNWKNALLPRLRDVKNKSFLILFDAEDTSRKQAKELCDELIDRGFPAACRFYYDTLNQENKLHFGEKVDANQILQERGNVFLQDLTQRLIDDAHKDFVTAEKSITKKNATRVAAAAKAKEIEEWESFNGKIESNTLNELVNAANYLQTFTAFNINAQNVQSSKTKHALAICKFYTPYAETADNFFVMFDDAKTKTKTAIKFIQGEGSEFVDTPSTVALEALLNISTAKLRMEVEDLAKIYKKKHTAWQKEEKKRLAREKAERQREEKKSRLIDLQLRLDSLREEKPSPERDNELIELIKKSCEWKLDVR